MALPSLRTPREHGGLLAVPPLAEADDYLRANRAIWQSTSLRLLGRPLVELRQLAGRELNTAASAFVTSLGLAAPEARSLSLIVTGHQPELFHPGVWVKNFAACGLARRHGCTALNLIVDNDAAKTTAIRVPILADGTPHTVVVAFDRWTGSAPYEELPVQDEALFANFPDAVRRQVQNWGFRPMLLDLWKETQRSQLLGERLAAIRRACEERWGCRNLELPVSRLCQTEAFAWFACHLLSDLPRFHQIHNTCRDAYRQARGIRSKSHPVPELAQQDDWWEAPFWAWQTGEMRRCRLFVRRTAGQLELRQDERLLASLPMPMPDRAAAAIGSWQALAALGIKIRPRALSTTLFARLFLADLFIHGIGGAIYDELTDAIVRAFYGLEPPRYLILSATMLLPLPPLELPSVSPSSARWSRTASQRTLRWLWYSPDCFLLDSATADPLLRDLRRRKRELVQAEPPDASGKRQRWQTIRKLNEELRAYLTQELAAAQSESVRAAKSLQAAAVLENREYAFCLHPEERLRRFMGQFLDG